MKGIIRSSFFAYRSSFLFRILSWPHAWGSAGRNLLYDWGRKRVYHAGVPVLCVGNLTAGGTGKTPMVEYLARRLRDKGLRVTILSRGYGSSDGPNDEALLLEENLPDVPHLQGRDRVELARIATEELESQILILDDGFQHRRLYRDLDIVLLDATDPFGGGRQLPAGLVRESVRSLRRADLILLTRCDALLPQERASLREQVFGYAGGDRPWAEVRFEPTELAQHGGATQPIQFSKDKKILAFCGIGNPTAFWNSLIHQGAVLLGRREFADHHSYTRQDLEWLASWAREHCPEALVTTQKDLVKLRVAELAGIPLFSLRIQAHFEQGADIIDQALREIMNDE